MKTKTKIIVIVLSVVMCFSVVFTTLLLSDAYYMMEIDKPSSIIVYCDEESNNIVFETNSYEYNKIYSLINKAYKQSTLQAIKNSALLKEVKIQSIKTSKIDFNGFKINFVYENPQTVKLKGDVYLINNKAYWYQNLIFDISNDNNYKYNNVAIIPPMDDYNYIGLNMYNTRYQAYSNFSKVYNYVNNLF